MHNINLIRMYSGTDDAFERAGRDFKEFKTSDSNATRNTTH